MFVILVYDISSNPEKKKKNYYRIVKTIENYLVRVQYSVFEGEIQPHLLKEMTALLKKSISKDFDSIMIYSFTNRAYTNKITLGVENEYALFS
ncbi:CRISPR-associated endonuclease Cas2 [Aquamicrobium sp.]|uniref:CRISPR-associated endonuclease Cas2 n=1 Tax=Aquamicrobium sp. TaxID=1872579 RepID=UPI002582A283|nr:CRISPR-associated endonuclease Cas2 [Aquamicrobium sp.]MCK9549266.1 CRISPR-associated endonuclease Cas2 [Aquamicrobium sp.]